MTLKIELLHEHALTLLRELERMKIIRLYLIGQVKVTAPTAPVQRKTFTAIQLDTRGFKFNREEANER